MTPAEFKANSALKDASVVELLTMLDRAAEALETLDELGVTSRLELISLMNLMERLIEDAE